VWAALLWAVVPWRPSLRLPSRALLGELLSFGRWIVVVNVLSAIVHHADKLFIGRELGSAALGLYQAAAKVIEVSITVWIWVVSRVLFPAFSRLHARGEALGPAYLRAMRALALVTLPGSVALALLAEPVVVTLFGLAWRDAAPILRALAIYGGLRSLGSSAGDALKASGAAGTLAGLAALKAAILLPAVAFAARRGAPAVATAVAAAALAGLVIDLALVARRMAVGTRAYARALAPGVTLALAVGVTTAALEVATRGRPEPLRLALALVAAGAVFAAGAARFEPGLVRAVRERLAAWRLARRGAEEAG
jgi:PST family polysaccharide transporter